MGSQNDRRTDKFAPKAMMPENMVCGRNALRELLSADRPIDKILVQRGDRDGSLSELLFTARKKKIPFTEVDKSKLDALTCGAKHQGIVAYVPEAEYATLDEIFDLAADRGEPPLIVICDGVEDPHNLGAIIRTAECVGAHGVVIPKRRSVGLTPAVAKASAGAIAHMKVCKVTNLVSTVEDMKKRGLWIYAADMDGTPYWGQDLKGPMALVLGGEGSGVSKLLKESCDFVLSIPLWGQVNSLNVSNAAAVLLCEVARQRKG